MTFEENPFRVLNVSIYADKATIIERADDLSFADPDREEIIEHARDTLLNPRKRIAAEFWELIGDEIVRDAGNANIIAVDKKFSALNADEIRKQINAARKQSKFPEVQDTAAIRDEINNLRDEINQKIQNSLTSIIPDKYADLADELIAAKKPFGVIVEDFFENYRLDMIPYPEKTAEKIFDLLTEIKDHTNEKILNELLKQIMYFVDVQRPLDKFSEALGMNDFAATEEIFYTVRNAAIKLFNEKDLIDDPLILTRTLEQNFSYLPHLAALIRKDIKFLEEAKARRPTQAFLVAKAELENILAALKKNLRFKEGADNINFYIDVFKPRHQVILQRLMIQSRYKPDEWQYLNALAAAIYLKVGNAMTWGDFRPYLTRELFTTAFLYAKVSGDAELISITRKRAEEWSEIYEKDRPKAMVNFDDDSSGCGCFLIVINITFVLCAILNFLGF